MNRSFMSSTAWSEMHNNEALEKSEPKIPYRIIWSLQLHVEGFVARSALSVSFILRKEFNIYEILRTTSNAVARASLSPYRDFALCN